mgnify:CR=1 FL=1
MPEGSYSSDPSNPSSRVTEMKQMVKGLHKNNIRVIMDVVYSHVHNAANHRSTRRSRATTSAMTTTVRSSTTPVAATTPPPNVR